MTPKERAAMQMALEALKDLVNGWKYIRSSHGDLYGVGWDRAEGKGDTAITALCEALAQPQVSDYDREFWGDGQPQENTARCGGCNKTAEDGWALYCVECWEKAQPQDNLNCKSVQKRLATSWGYVKAAQAEQEPVVIGSVLQKVMARLADLLDEDQFNNINSIVEGAGYAAPVRTKNLTDDEIYPLYPECPMCDKDMIDFARAVIAKFKEKNK